MKKGTIKLIDGSVIEAERINRRVEHWDINESDRKPVQFYLIVTTKTGEEIEIPYSSILSINYGGANVEDQA